MERGQRGIYERTSRQNFGVFKGRNQAPSERNILSKEGPARGSRFLKLKKSFHNCSIKDLAKSQTAGFEQHLLKPFAPAIVEAILREAAEEVPQ